jgi:hypothetical protein
MSIKVTGTVKAALFGMGAWSLESTNGQTYEIYQPAPSQLLQDNLQVEVTGTIRDDVMTIAMIGPVLAVEEYVVLKK